MTALLKHAGTGLAAVLVGLALPAYGNIYSFSTPSGATSSDNEALNATAVFTTSANSIQLVLTNLQSTFSAGQLLADVSFMASGVTGSTVISNVSFSFGTGEENSAPGVPVPIPAAVWLFGSGLLGLIGIARRKYTGIAIASPVPA